MGRCERSRASEHVTIRQARPLWENPRGRKPVGHPSADQGREWQVLSGSILGAVRDRRGRRKRLENYEKDLSNPKRGPILPLQAGQRDGFNRGQNSAPSPGSSSIDSELLFNDANAGIASIPSRRRSHPERCFAMPDVPHERLPAMTEGSSTPEHQRTVPSFLESAAVRSFHSIANGPVPSGNALQ